MQWNTKLSVLCPIVQLPMDIFRFIAASWNNCTFLHCTTSTLRKRSYNRTSAERAGKQSVKDLHVGLLKMPTQTVKISVKTVTVLKEAREFTIIREQQKGCK